MDSNLDAGMEFAELAERGQQRVDGAFVDTEREFTAIEPESSVRLFSLHRGG